MLRIFTVIYLLLFATTAFAQYKLDKAIYFEVLDPDTYMPGMMAFKGVKDTVYIIQKGQPVGDSISYRIKKLNLRSRTITQVDSISLAPNFNLRDVFISGNHLLLVGNAKMIHYNFVSKKLIWHKWDKDKDYNHAVYRNDNTVVLYTIANYHPADGPIGAVFNVYNLYTATFESKKVIHFPGVGLSGLTINWAIFHSGKLRLFTPFSSKMYTFDQGLNIIDSITLPVFKEHIVSNIGFENELDSLVYSEWNRIDGNYRKYPKDTIDSHPHLKTSFVYTKDFIADISKQVRKNFPFIEKVFYLDDETIGLSVSRPGYELEYRDFIFYNPNKNEIIQVYKKWRTGRADSVKSKEDFFVVDLINDETVAPYFHKGKIYSSSSYPVDLFETGSLKDVKEMYFNHVNEKGYKWQILEFEF